MLKLPEKLVNYCKELGPAYTYTRYPDVVEIEDIDKTAEKLLAYAREVNMVGRKALMAELECFKSRLQNTMVVSKTVLFGPLAEGKGTKDSDVDLIIVSEAFKNYDFIQRAAKMYDYWTSEKPVDFLCYTPDEFNSLRKKVTIVRHALKRGISV